MQYDEERCSGVSWTSLVLVAFASVFLGAYLESWRMRTKSRLEEGFLANVNYGKLTSVQTC